MAQPRALSAIITRGRAAGSGAASPARQQDHPPAGHPPGVCRAALWDDVAGTSGALKERKPAHIAGTGSLDDLIGSVAGDLDGADR